MIEVLDLTKKFGGRTAVDGISFTAQTGEIVGFLGPNGAGKTTTMRILTCYMPATGGTARVCGYDVHESPLEVRSRIGYLPESAPLYPDMRVSEFLDFAAGARGLSGKEKHEAIDKVTAECGLGDVRTAIIKTLSKGYRQRVGLAQAIVHEPEVLVLDEPTAGLDPKQIIEIRQLIQSLSGGRTIILSSHILPEVTKLCQRVVIINKGKIAAVDSPANLNDRMSKTGKFELEIGPGSGGTGVLQLAAEIGARLAGMRGIISAEQVSSTSPSGSCVIRVESELSAGDFRPHAARAVIEAGADLLELKRVGMSLEDIFIELVTHEPASSAATTFHREP